MEIIITDTPDEVARVAADIIAGVVRSRPDAVLGVATGSSPGATYQRLAKLSAPSALGRVDFSAVTVFALDEYVGLPAGHPESYAAVVSREIVRPLGIDPANAHVPDGSAADADAAAAAYDAAIAGAGGIDLQLLGIGRNGHVGFNEPSSSLSSRTRVKTLAPQTRADNARFFDSPDQVPVHCITQGLGTIGDARRLLLVAQGAEKADAIAHAVEGPLSSRWPASILQLHRHATVVVDDAAASGLALADYYRSVQEFKPRVA
ncbi:glucosamine-6-phosphate deaminase [Herbiconiux sp. UC225_62]|uniref:glucosamine-6-phosphate deaminase n=1 Tax=Herbiconiux sp. UC225_62 TaxID=3350168 RepID=UPI0036D386B6